MTTLHHDQLAQRKASIRILLLGAYRPDTCQNQLLSLKRFLVERGFHQTRLVSDFSDDQLFHPTSENIHFQQKSFYYMEHWAQLLVFVLHKGCNPMGVLREFARIVEHNPAKTHVAVLLRSEKISLSSLIKADIEAHQIRAYTYTDQDDLNAFTYAACFSILDTLPGIRK